MGERIEANGLNTYYEVQGEGEPVVLLHGGGGDAGNWSGQMSALAEHYRVYAPDRRGHGRTPDVEGPITGAAMAEDTIAFLQALGTGPVCLIGWSDGSTVAAHMALRRPDLIRKLVLMGMAVSRDGETAKAQALSQGSGREEVAAALRPDYEAKSPDGPEHFPVIFEKLMTFWEEGAGIGVSALAAIQMPTLVMMGDDDGIRIEHAVAMVRTLADSQFAVIPGASHTALMEKPALVNMILLDFLAEEQQPKWLPLGALDQ